MGRLITNPPKPVIRVKVSPYNYWGLYNLSNSFCTSVINNVSKLGTLGIPFPVISTLTSANIALLAALLTLGTKNNKGSHSDLLNVQSCSFTVYNLLTGFISYYQGYINPSQPPTLQRYIISLMGISTKSPKSKIDKLQIARNVHQSNNKQFPVTLRRIAWRKSLGLFKGVRAKAYNIYAIPAVGSPIFLTSVTKTNYQVPTTIPGTSTPITTVRIHPVNAQGEGNSVIIDVK